MPRGAVRGRGLPWAHGVSASGPDIEAYTHAHTQVVSDKIPTECFGMLKPLTREKEGNTTIR